jgi:hypothetical protein
MAFFLLLKVPEEQPADMDRSFMHDEIKVDDVDEMEEVDLKKDQRESLLTPGERINVTETTKGSLVVSTDDAAKLDTSNHLMVPGQQE